MLHRLLFLNAPKCLSAFLCLFHMPSGICFSNHTFNLEIYRSISRFHFYEFNIMMIFHFINFYIHRLDQKKIDLVCRNGRKSFPFLCFFHILIPQNLPLSDRYILFSLFYNENIESRMSKKDSPLIPAIHKHTTSPTATITVEIV